MLMPIDDIEAALAALLDRTGPDARIALPKGPQTAPYLLETTVLYQLRRPL
jgi:hypothetical protein